MADKFSRNYIFRLSNYTDSDVATLSTLDKQTRYIVFGKEICPTTGTPHLQGYIIFKNPKSPRQCTLYFGERLSHERTHTEPQYKHSNPQKNIDYCTKDNNYIELGSPPAPSQGQRSDLLRIKLMIAEGKTYEEILEEEFVACAKFGRFIRECIATRDASLLPKTELPNLFTWEVNLIEIINKPPQDRVIYWIVDEEGGKGKSTFARYLIDHYNAFYTNGGKGTDTIHAYNNQPVVIFDYVRQAEEYVNYGVMEAIKNGVAFSPKYESQLKRFKVPHVIAFSNFYPDLKLISKDRIKIISI